LSLHNKWKDEQQAKIQIFMRISDMFQMKEHILLAVTLLIFSTSFLNLQEVWAVPPIAGKIILCQGEVTIKRYGEINWKPPEENMLLFAGDEVKTYLGKAYVLGVDGNSFELDHNASKILERFTPSPHLCLTTKYPTYALAALSAPGDIFVEAGTVEAGTVEVGTLDRINGKVWIRRAKEVGWRNAELNRKVYHGDTVKTGGASRAAILFKDESRIVLSENTLFTFSASISSPPISRKIEVLQGEIQLKLPIMNKGFEFELDTPTVVVEPRG
jgi:hypothetical protein